MRAPAIDRLRRLAGLLAGAVRHALQDNVLSMAGALTYHALLSLFTPPAPSSGSITTGHGSCERREGSSGGL